MRNLPKTSANTPATDTPAESTTTPAVAPPVTDDDLGMTAPAYGVSTRKPRAVVPIRQYRVERGPLPSGGWSVMTGYGRTELGPGKIIDCRQYDIERLKNQGVQLTEIGEING